MRAYKLEMLGSSCTFDSLADLIIEVTTALEEGSDDEIVIRPIEMTDEEYKQLPEFQGW